MDQTLRKILENELKEVRAAGLYKEERIILTPQGSRVKVPEGLHALFIQPPSILPLSVMYCERYW